MSERSLSLRTLSFRSGTPLGRWLETEIHLLRTLGEARGLAEAAPQLFGVVGPGLLMDVGTLWLIEHRTGALRAAYVWRGKSADAAGYEQAIRRSAVKPGEDLAGRAWADMAPVWRDPKTRRGEVVHEITAAAREDGLRLGLAFPIRSGGEFHGVLELAARKSRRSVEDLTLAAEVLGEALGQFLVRQGALQRLSASERRLTDLFANAPLGVMVADAAGRVLHANEAELEIVGRSKEAYVGHPLSESHVDHDVLADVFARAGRGEEVRGCETQVRRPDGTVVWIRLHANGSFEDGRLHQVRWFSRDVSQEREAARLLRESEERFRLLVEGARDYALHTYDAEGRIAAWSLGARTLFGWSDEEAAGLRMVALFGPEDRAEDLPSRLLQLAEDEGRLLHDGWLVRSDGSRFWANVSLTAVRDPNGRVTHVCQLTRDATETRRVEGLRHKTSQLEAANEAVLLVQRRTAELLDALRCSIEGPVQAIERVAAQFEAGEVDEATRAVRLSAVALRRALDGASATGAVDTVPRVSDGDPVDVFRLACEARDMLRDAAAERRVRVEVDVDPDFGQLVGQADRLRQVLFNLLSNAIRFNRERGRVQVRFLGEGDAAVRLEVEDTGIGIPEERIASLFGGFGSADGEAAVGLAATKRVVAEAGGRIAVRSTLGRGSVFSVVLPRVPSSAPPTTGSGTGRNAPALRVLAVEADPAVRASLSWTFGGAGYAVETEESVSAGVEAARERRFDVLVASLDRPSASLADLVAAVREGGESRHVSEIVGLAHVEGAAPGALLVSDVVARPAAADRLLEAVERARVPRGRGRAILVVDADVPVLQATARLLEALDYRVIAEPDADAALRAAAAEPPAAVILSPFPMVLDAFQFLGHLRRMPGLADVPTILCAPRTIEEHREGALRAGAAGPDARLSEVLVELERRLVRGVEPRLAAGGEA